MRYIDTAEIRVDLHEADLNFSEDLFLALAHLDNPIFTHDCSILERSKDEPLEMDDSTEYMATLCNLHVSDQLNKIDALLWKEDLIIEFYGEMKAHFAWECNNILRSQEWRENNSMEE